MAEDTQSPEERIKEAIWQWTGWTTIVLLTFLAGAAVAWLMWGDAPKLRTQVEDLTKSVAAARVERENALMKQGQLERANEAVAALKEMLAQCKSGAAAPANP